MNVDGRKIVITGAAGGLGSAMVRGLADAGADVYVLDIDDANAQALVNEVRAHSEGRNRATYLRCDLNDLAGTGELVAGLARDVGGIDVLVNNAAIYPSKPFEDYGIEEYQSVQRVNVEAAVVCVSAVLPSMKKAGRGRIINISSITFCGGWANCFPM
jgi:3-oxoacyl-[acyl-carrier protein] reductase